MNNELKNRLLSSIFLVPLTFFFIFKGSILFIVFLVVLFFISSYEWFKMSRNKNYHLLGYIFLLISFISVLNLRNISNEQGLFIFLLVTLICISTDIGGYVFGKIFKGPKLTKISPKKTYAGVIGGIMISLLITIIYIKFNNFNNVMYNEISIQIVLLVFFVSIISQIGDITVSFFKRLSKIKNTGILIPGHGGLLDRIDGMIFAFPFTYFLLMLEII